MRRKTNNPTALKAGIVVPALLICILAGCINYEEELWINKDGSGKVVMHYWTSEKLASLIEQKEKQAREEERVGLPFSEDQARRDLDIPDVLKVESFEKTVQKGYRHITITLSFEEGKINELGKSLPFFADSEISFTEDEHRPGNWIFKRTLGTKKLVAVEEDKTDPGDTLAKSVLSAYRLKFVVHFPGRVLKTNGQPLEEGEQPPRFQWLWGQRKAVWEFPLVDVTKTPEMTATVRIGYRTQLLVAAFIAVIIILIIVIVKARPPASSSAEETGEEKTESEAQP